MPTALADPLLARVRRELEATFGKRLARVVLFGSRARGDFHEDSDWDIAVFLDPFLGRSAEADRLAEITSAIMLETGEVVWMQPFPLERLDEPTLLMRDVREEGVAL